MIRTFPSARFRHWQASGNSLLYSPATKFPSSGKSLSTFQSIFQHIFLVSKEFSFYLQSHFQLHVLHDISLSTIACPPAFGRPLSAFSEVPGYSNGFIPRFPALFPAFGGLLQCTWWRPKIPKRDLFYFSCLTPSLQYPTALCLWKGSHISGVN